MRLVIATSFLLHLGVVFSETLMPMVRTLENGNATLACMGDFGLITDSERVLYWIAPDFTGIGANSKVGVVNEEGIPNMFVENGSLVFDNVSASADGLYMCVFRSSEDPDFKVQVNRIKLFVVPNFTNKPAWDLYKSNFTVGFLVSGIVLAFVLFSCMVYQFRYKVKYLHDKDKPDKKRISLEEPGEQM